jgi:hypothetical protein
MNFVMPLRPEWQSMPLSEKKKAKAKQYNKRQKRNNVKNSR